MFEIALTTFFSGHSFRRTAHLIGVPKSTVFSTGSNASKTSICDLDRPKLSRLYERVKDIVFRFVNHDPFRMFSNLMSDLDGFLYRSAVRICSGTTCKKDVPLTVEQIHTLIACIFSPLSLFFSRSPLLL